MNAKRFWIEIIALASAIALAIALLIATLGAAAGTVMAQDENAQSAPSPTSRTFRGMVTCSRCGAKHSATLNRSASDCVRICVHNGAAFALVDGDKIYQLDGDLSLIKKVAGQRAEITGIVQGNTITVSSVTAASENRNTSTLLRKSHG
jgi:hypothetical protein